jgi:predicted signal transduction protein with EAL and GGDEF domain
VTVANSGDTPSTMLQRADAALYEAKRAGRNCVKVRLATSEAAAQEQTAASDSAVGGSAHVEFA